MKTLLAFCGRWFAVGVRDVFDARFGAWVESPVYRLRRREHIAALLVAHQKLNPAKALALADELMRANDTTPLVPRPQGGN